MQFAQQHYRSMNISEADMSALEAKAQEIGIAELRGEISSLSSEGSTPCPARLEQV